MSKELSCPAVGEQESWLRAGKAIEFPADKPDTIEAPAWEQTRTFPAVALATLVDLPGARCVDGLVKTDSSLWLGAVARRWICSSKG